MNKFTKLIFAAVIAASTLSVVGCTDSGTKITPKEFDATKLAPLDAGVGGGTKSKDVAPTSVEQN